MDNKKYMEVLKDNIKSRMPQSEGPQPIMEEKEQKEDEQEEKDSE